MAFWAVLGSQMTESYSIIGLTSEQYSALRGDANLNSVIICLIKLKDFKSVTTGTLNMYVWFWIFLNKHYPLF